MVVTVIKMMWIMIFITTMLGVVTRNHSLLSIFTYIVLFNC